MAPNQIVRHLEIFSLQVCKLQYPTHSRAGNQGRLGRQSIEYSIPVLFAWRSVGAFYFSCSLWHAYPWDTKSIVHPVNYAEDQYKLLLCLVPNSHFCVSVQSLFTITYQQINTYDALEKPEHLMQWKSAMNTHKHKMYTPEVIKVQKKALT